MVNIPLFIGFHTSQVVQDSSHQQYEALVLFFFTRNFLHRFRGSGFFDDSFFFEMSKASSQNFPFHWMISEKLFVCWLPPFEVRKSPSSTMKFLVASFADRCRVFFFSVQRKRRNSSFALQKMLAYGNRMVVYL